MAGILLLVRQPFNVGDAAEVADHAGSVVEITARDTVLKTWDGEQVILPNIDVFTSAITNYSRLPHRRRTIHIGGGYGVDVSRAERLFLKAIQSVEGVLQEPAPTVLAEGLGDSALRLSARFWGNQETHSLFQVHSAAAQKIKGVAEEEGIELPYPIQTVRLEGPWPTGRSLLPPMTSRELGLSRHHPKSGAEMQRSRSRQGRGTKRVQMLWRVTA